ncbi:MAG TPA: TIGR03557 family F420-dependent LLM class oxidoreductase [Frankiaceae bacterium]|nr:TIGR03557 family F420-dependent LLM class oxidoreductase [Frankiaceae bacterium]
MKIGYTLMCEQRGPKSLVEDAVLAEQAGFDFAVISDHYSPWLAEQGHSPYAWSVLGAAAAKTERIDLMTYVTCPTFRYHPAIVAQKAATVALLSDNRFRLGLGAGERLNEQVVGAPWPAVDIRHDMLREAVEIIRGLWDGDFVNYRGEHFDVESAKLYDLPERPIPLGIAVSGKQSCELAGEHADVGVAVEPDAEIVRQFADFGGAGKPMVGQSPCCYGTDEKAAIALSHQQFRWFGGGWKVNAELPGPSAFDAASQFVREADMAEQIPHGPDPQAYIETVRRWAEAGFAELAFVQIGPDQAQFCEWFSSTLRPRLQELSLAD